MNVQNLSRRYNNPLFWMVLVLLLIVMIFTSCKDGPTDPETERITKTITPTDGSTTLPDATLYDDDSGDELGVGETDLTRDKGTTLTVRAEADGFHSATESVSFTSSGEVEIALEADNPDEVAVNFEIRDSETDSLVAGNLLADGEVVSEAAATGTVTFSYSETPVELCTEPTYFQEGCESITPDENQEVTLEINRIPVDVTVNVVDESGSAVNNPTIVVDDYTYTNGETTHSFGARAGDRDILVTASGYDSLETSISADESHNLEAEIADLPECSDGIDNDGVDGIDEEDPGCLDSDGNYDPEDDNETLKVATLTLGSTAKDETRFVSGADGEQEFIVMGSHVQALPVSIQQAVTITVEVEIKVSASQTGEEFALQWHTGPDDSSLNTVNMTEIAIDQGRDGWVFAEFRNIDKNFFVNGTSYEVLAIHATKVRGEEPTDGNDDVVFLEAGDGTTRSFIIQWEYQPEDVE